jgi:predicted lipid-binding transport protein (Tim44 family)
MTMLLSGLGLTPIGPPTARTVPFAGTSPANNYSSAASPATASSSRGAQIAAAGASIAAPLLPGLIGGGGVAATTAGGGTAAGGAGIGLAGALTITGIAAGAAILAWAIIAKGLFRGGEEALKVSPARDEYFNAFNKQLGLPLGNGGDDTALTLGFRRFAESFKAADGGGIPGYEVDRMLRRIHKADKVTEWQAATADVEQTWRAYESLPATGGPPWRVAQLQGGVVFANGQTQAQLVAATIALGSGYADLVADYRRGFA